MPVTTNGIGYGAYTPIKIQHLSKIFEMHLSITRAVLNNHPYYTQTYHYIDATSGSGRTPDGTNGSPLVFLERIEADKFRMNYRADFIECNASSMAELQKAIKMAAESMKWRIANIKYHPDCYEAIIPNLLPGVDDKELGLLYVDPSGDLMNFDTIGYVSKARPKLDILLYIPTTNIKRVFGTTHKLLSDFLNDIGKSHWLIRKPFPNDRHKWTFLLGSNTNIFKTYKRIDFLLLDSPEAQVFWPKLNLSKKQLFLQTQPILPNLFDENDE